jgi:hypothetical protein
MAFIDKILHLVGTQLRHRMIVSLCEGMMLVWGIFLTNSRSRMHDEPMFITPSAMRSQDKENTTLSHETIVATSSITNLSPGLLSVISDQVIDVVEVIIR